MSNLIEEAIREYFGERCPDFEPGCPCCRAWAEFDQVERLRAALHDVLGWHDYSNDMHKPIEVRAAYMRARAALEGK